MHEEPVPPPFHPILRGRPGQERVHVPADEVTALLRWYVTDLQSQGEGHTAGLLDQVADDMDCSMVDWMSQYMAGWPGFPGHDYI